MDRAAAVLDRLRAIADPDRLPGMARFGIDVSHALGVSIPELRALARTLGPDHRLAAALWATGVHEARILATMVDEPDRVTRRQMDRWVRTLHSWDVCDHACTNLFDRTPFAIDRATAWSVRPEEFVRRAAFATIAGLAVHARDPDDGTFEGLLPLIEAAADDDRQYVKKAVSWALRQVGKRNAALNVAALATAERIHGRGTRAARWIASEALRELTSDAVRARLRASR
jgi:3-methyladenine DNA glycosylase AlkD